MWFDQMADTCQTLRTRKAHISSSNFIHGCATTWQLRLTTFTTPTATRPRKSSWWKMSSAITAIYPDAGDYAEYLYHGDALGASKDPAGHCYSSVDQGEIRHLI